MTATAASLDAFRAWVQSGLRRRAFRQVDSGVSDTTLRAFLRGRPIRADSVQRIARATGAHIVLAAGAAAEAARFHDAAVQAGWAQRRRAPTVAPRRLPPTLSSRHYTLGGRWLRDEVLTRWGSLSAFQRDTRIEYGRTLHRYFFSRTFHPKHDTLERLAAALTRKRTERGDPPVTVAQLLSRFGHGLTYEDARRTAQPQTCELCGAPAQRRMQTCGWTCRSLRMILRGGLPTPGAQRLFALMAAAGGRNTNVIARALKTSSEVVAGWLGGDGAREVIVRLREALETTSPHAPMLAIAARVLGVTRRSLRECLHHRAFRSGRTRAVRPRRMRRAALTRLVQALDLTPEACLAAFHRDGVHEAALAQRMPGVQRLRWQPSTGGRRRSGCALVRQIVQLRTSGLPTAKIAERLARAPWHRTAMTDAQVRWLPIEHVRGRGHRHGCTRCRPIVADDLARHGSSLRTIARRLGVSVGTVARDLKTARASVSGAPRLNTNASLDQD